MKKVFEVLNCLTQSLKKKFFNVEKNDKYHGCKKVLNFDKNSSTPEEENSFNEYLESYKVTTRWQTL